MSWDWLIRRMESIDRRASGGRSTSDTGEPSAPGDNLGCSTWPDVESIWLADADESTDIYESRRDSTERRGSGGRSICSDWRSRDGGAGSINRRDAPDGLVPPSSPPASSLSWRKPISDDGFGERSERVDLLTSGGKFNR